ncbi:MAG: hypothetical protein AB7P23_04900 [Amphiplicatus sp.]
MGSYRFVVLANPTEGMEDEFNKWYNETHLKEVLQVPGFVAAQRFKIHRPSLLPHQKPAHDYLAIYEIETDDIEATLADLRSRPNTPAMSISKAFDLTTVSPLIYESLTPRKVSD